MMSYFANRWSYGRLTVYVSNACDGPDSNRPCHSVSVFFAVAASLRSGRSADCPFFAIGDSLRSVASADCSSLFITFSRFEWQRTAAATQFV